MDKPELGMWRADGAAGRMLAGRPEREAVLEFLQAAYAREYLTEAEHERRAALALGARDCRMLGEQIRDLPYSIELPDRQPVPVPARRSLLDMHLSELARAAVRAVAYLLAGAAAGATVLMAVWVMLVLTGQA